MQVQKSEDQSMCNHRVYITDTESEIYGISSESAEAVHNFIELDKVDVNYRLIPQKTTILFDAGRKNKLRPGDILGALTAGLGLDKSQVGKIDIFDFHAYVSIDNAVAKNVVKEFENKKIKGKNIRARILR